MTFVNDSLDELLKELVEPVEESSDLILTQISLEQLGIEGIEGIEYMMYWAVKLCRKYEHKINPFIIDASTRALHEAITNAYMWGYNRMPFQPITVTWFCGSKGYLFFVEDDGNGFDVAKLKKKFEAREEYASRSGGGFDKFNAEGIRVNFDKGGRRVYVCVTASLNEQNCE